MENNNDEVKLKYPVPGRIGSATNPYGFSKKTNIGLAGIAAIATAKDSWQAILAVVVVVLFCVSLQYRLDNRKCL